MKNDRRLFLVACQRGLVGFSTLVVACGTAPSVPADARTQLAPTGKLRVGLLSSNPMYVTQVTPPGDLRGAAVDMGRELAKQLGVEFAPVRYPGINQMLAGAKAQEWDVAFLAIDPERGDEVEYTAPYMEVDFTYLVSPRSPIRNIAEADASGRRIAAARGSVGDLVLSRTLKQAILIRTDGISAAFEMLSADKVDALVSNRLSLMELSKKLPGSRVLDGRFHGAPIGAATHKSRPAGANYLKQFIEQAKASGFVKAAIDRAGMQGVSVAPLSRK
jgi:polar amino acid transport system substrate-binding protein